MTRKEMPEKAEYRSAIRSRKLIKQAYVELIREKDIGKITVKDIVTRADINRGTFYAHYKSVNAVEDQIGKEIATALFDFLDEFKDSWMVENPLPFLKKIQRFLENDLEFYRLLIDSQRTTVFLNKLKERFVKRILSDEKKMSVIKNKEQFVVCVRLFASGFVSLYHDWFNHRINTSLNDLTLIFSEIIRNEFKAFVPRKK
jgi:AcrR family transcriptional regulator